jgi:hypothetical protein
MSPGLDTMREWARKAGVPLAEIVERNRQMNAFMARFCPIGLTVPPQKNIYQGPPLYRRIA